MQLMRTQEKFIGPYKKNSNKEVRLSDYRLNYFLDSDWVKSH